MKDERSVITGEPAGVATLASTIFDNFIAQDRPLVFLVRTVLIPTCILKAPLLPELYLIDYNMNNRAAASALSLVNLLRA